MRNMKQLVQALAMAGIAMAASTAHAELMTAAQTFSFSGTNSVSDDDTAAGLTSKSNVSLDKATVTQFNSATGVLTGVSISLNGSQTQTTQVVASNGPDNGTNKSVTSNGTGSSVVQLSAAGITQTFSSLSSGASCTGTRLDECTGTPVSSLATPTAITTNVTSSLNSYVGTGGTDIAFKAATLSATQIDNQFTGTETTTSTVTWEGTGTVVYNYLLHADGSFSDNADKNIFSLDFGTVAQGSTDPLLSFSIYNLAAANRTGLDLLTGPESGNIAALTTNFGATTNLLQGASKTFSAMLDTANLGDFTATYVFNLSDTNIGASNSFNTSTLTLNLKGTVAARAADVPEPLSAALLGIGMLGIAAVRRRK